MMSSQTISTPARDIPSTTTVLVSGGGPVGTALAVDLAQRGIDCVVIERRLEINPMVKAHEISAPSMELLAQWGVADELRALTGGNSHASIWFRGPLAQEPLGEVAWVAPDLSHVSEAPHTAHQRLVNRLLRERAVELGVTHVMGWVLDDLRQDADGVTAVLRCTQTAETREVRCAYLAGADGAKSTTRLAAGIERDESELLAKHYNIVINTPDLVERLGGEPTMGNMVWSAERHSMCAPTNMEFTTWRHIIGPFSPDHELDDAGTVDLIREIVGADIEVEVVQRGSFPIQERIARAYRAGRVFLLGDAAHLFPPYMGQNMNVGLGDAGNLGWKLAAVLHGWGQEGLLDSYGAERRPVAVRTAQAAIRAWRTLLDVQSWICQHGLADPAGLSDSEKRQMVDQIYETSFIEWNKDGVVLDVRYDQSPVVADDGVKATPWEHTKYRPQSKPGHRLPHVWLPDGGGSVYSLLGPYYTLLNVGADISRVEDATQTARAAGVPMTVADLSSYALQDVYGADLVLVRGDRFVAWRGDSLAADSDVWHVLSGAQAVVDKQYVD